MLFILRQR